MRSASASSRYESLDLWRGVACLSVVLCHSVALHLKLSANSGTFPSTVVGALGALWIGVPMFFVISGYCIAAAADRTRENGRCASGFFVRRFRRIYPPLWVAIGAAIGFFYIVDFKLSPGLLSSQPWAQLRPWWYSPSQWFGNLTLTETWRPHLFGSPRVHFPSQAWTLCYEEQFYAVIGVLLLTARRHLFQGVAAVTVVTAGVLVASNVMPIRVDGFFFDGNWLMFAAGVLVYWVAASNSLRLNAVASGVLVLGMLASPVIPAKGCAVAFGLALLLIWLRRWDNRIAGYWALAPIRACGEMCYSLYLVHVLVVRAVSAAFSKFGLSSDSATLLVTVPACVALSVLAGLVFYGTVERRFLNSKARQPAAAAHQTSIAPVRLGVGTGHIKP